MDSYHCLAPPPLAFVSLVICQFFAPPFFKKLWGCQIREAIGFAMGCYSYGASLKLDMNDKSVCNPAL